MRHFAYLLIVLAACTTTESDDVLTSGIHAQIAATSLGDGKTTVMATLFVGDPIGLNFVELAGDDRLVAKHGTTTKPMVQSEFLNTVSHRAEFAVDAEGEQFEVAFERSIDRGAPRSTMVLPAKFDVGAAPASVSRASALTVTWSPSGSADAMSWEVTGDCVQREASPIDADPGTVTIAAGVIEKRADQNAPDTCTVTVAIRRTRAGSLDPNYGKGGTAAGVQERRVTFTSTP